MAVIDNAVYVDGRRIADPTGLDETFEVLQGCGGMAWIGLYRPDEAEIRSVAAEFGLHELPVQDAIKAHQRPKMERYGDTLFMVLHPARYLDDVEEVEFGELHVFVGPNFVITIRQAESPDLARVRRRLEGNPELLRLGPEAVLYAILDQVVDEYAPVVAGLENDIDEIEDQLFEGDPAVSRRIYELTREVIEFQRATHSAARTSCRPWSTASTSTASIWSCGAICVTCPTSRTARRTGRCVPGPAAERAHRECHPGRAAAERGDAVTDRGQPGAERGGQEDLGVGGDPVRTHPDRHHLRDELRRTCPSWAGRSATRWPCSSCWPWAWCCTWCSNADGGSERR